MKQVLIALDQLFNALAGGWADETLSCRCWRRRGDRVWGLAQRTIDKCFFWQPNHCRKSYDAERLRLQAPPELRRE